MLPLRASLQRGTESSEARWTSARAEQLNKETMLEAVVSYLS